MTDQHYKEYVHIVANTLGCNLYQLAMKLEKQPQFFYHYNVSAKKKVQACHLLRQLVKGRS